VRETISKHLRGSVPEPDPVAAALAQLPAGIAAKWFTAPLVPAAVLVPLVSHASGMTVLFTQRTAHLKDHPGQISFPGGRVEPEDQGPLQTALREVHEEIGLSPDLVQVAGYLKPLAVVTGFAVTPVVGFVEPGFQLVIDDFEVAEVFEVPLTFLLDDENLKRSTRNVRGTTVPVVEYQYRQYRIWGATAQMLQIFIKLINDYK
jgi:8-oxo-dGTP pyrophosphatase MutT (NUDIX family)